MFPLDDNPTSISHFIDAFATWPLIIYLLLRGCLTALDEGVAYLCRVGTSLLEAYYNFRKRLDALRASYQKKPRHKAKAVDESRNVSANPRRMRRALLSFGPRNGYHVSLVADDAKTPIGRSVHVKDVEALVRVVEKRNGDGNEVRTCVRKWGQGSVWV